MSLSHIAPIRLRHINKSDEILTRPEEQFERVARRRRVPRAIDGLDLEEVIAMRIRVDEIEIESFADG